METGVVNVINFTINFKIILYIIIIYPFFKPYYFSQLEFMQASLNDFMYIFSMVVIICLYISKLPYLMISRGFVLSIIYYFLIFISTYLNNAITIDSIIFYAVTLGFLLILNYCLFDRQELLNFLAAIKFLIYIYVLVNLISMFAFPNGIPAITERIDFPYYVFGNTNNVIKYALPGLCFSFIHDSIKYGKIKIHTWLLLGLIFLTLLMSWSVTAIIGLLIFTIIQFNKIGEKQIFITYIATLLGSMIVTIFLLFFKNNSNLFAWILGLLGKDSTLTNREPLWMNALESIKNSPVWGYGIQNEEIINYYIGNYFGAHNYFLDTLFRGGFISLIVLLIILFFLSKKLFRSNGNLMTRALIGTCSAYFIMWSAEPFMNTEYIMFSIIFLLSFKINILEEYYYNKPKLNHEIGNLINVS